MNHKIRVPQIRCVLPDGEMGGIMSTRDAMRMAEEHGLDLVEISPNADPPVCRIMDFGKFRYDEALKKKKARRQSLVHNRTVKEVKFHSNVAEHDYQTKVGHTREFLEKGHKVKLTLQYRGRENAHKELGMQVVTRVIKDCDDVGLLELEPKMMGRSLFAMLGPRPVKHKQGGGASPAARPTQPAEQAPRVPSAAPVAPPAAVAAETSAPPPQKPLDVSGPDTVV
ncbi:MAG: translation initiation factor IF-3 [Verrucomicrobia bacterium]|nr:translation initiation factor IF-3 [Verrucomicrobiota bacterium]